MIKLRKSRDRGNFNHGWMHTRHSFSFGEYYDAQHTGWGNLRVINEDRVAPESGFGTHGHRDMEIISYVLQGKLTHQDSMGNVQGILPGDVQRMSAGTGVQHSEFNHAPDQLTHFLQIWIEPNEIGIAPSYEQKTILASVKHGQLVCIASPEGGADAVKIHADATVYAALLDGDELANLPLKPQRKAYVHLVRGRLSVNGQPLETGDAAMLQGETDLLLNHAQDAEVLVFDLAP